MTRWAWCGEVVRDDYGHDTPCRQIAAVTNVHVREGSPGPVTVCTIVCPVPGHRAVGVRLEDVCEMPD